MIEPLAQLHSQSRNAVSSVVNEESHRTSAPNVSMPMPMPMLTSPIQLHQHEKEGRAYKSGVMDEYEADQEDREPDLETATPKDLVVASAMVDDDTESTDETFGALFGCQPTTTDAAIFAFRMTTSMSLASLVVLLPPLIGDDSDEWPEAAWVYVTAGVVSWQAGPDTALVFKKLVERILGTLCGASIGLVIGFVSITVAQNATSEGDDNDYLRAQAVFLALTLSVVVFVGAFFATRTGYRGSYIADW